MPCELAFTGALFILDGFFTKMKNRVGANKFSILCGFFQNNVGFQNNHFARVTTKQKGIKKARYLSLII